VAFAVQRMDINSASRNWSRAKSRRKYFLRNGGVCLVWLCLSPDGDRAYSVAALPEPRPLLPHTAMTLPHRILPVIRSRAYNHFYAFQSFEFTRSRRMSTKSESQGTTVSTICVLSLWKLTTRLKPPRKTPLYDFHVQHGAKMVPFAGYQMPLVYGDVSQGPYFFTSRLE
jgi:hypothetical protein